MNIDFKKDLNEEQYQAATSDARHLRIIAGAGTGKTRTLTYRLAYLVSRNTYKPKEIVAITFTNKAAREMKERSRKILNDNGLASDGYPWISTFHAFCIRLLRGELASHFNSFTNKFTVIDRDDSDAYFKKAGKDLHIQIDKRFNEAKKYIQARKTEGKHADDIPLKCFESARIGVNIHELFAHYQELLAQADSLDFDDILIFSRDILKKDPEARKYHRNLYSSFMIDEFQDTNDLQYELVRLFMRDDADLCVVGDPDQTIYTWRGADNSLIKDRLKDDFKDLETVTLDYNYRSTQSILDKANLLIDNNKDRVKKDLKAISGEVGNQVELLESFTNDEEARLVASKALELHKEGFAFSDMAIIYRANFLSLPFEKQFPRLHVPYILYDATSFYARKEVKDGLAYMRLLINPGDSVSFERAIGNPLRHIGDKTLENLYKQANDNQMPLFGFILEHIDTLECTPSARETLKAFLKPYIECYNTIQNATTPEEYRNAIKIYFDKEGLTDYIKEIDRTEAQENDSNNLNDRLNNLMTLLDSLFDFIKDAIENPDGENEPTLTDYLISVALIAAQDQERDTDAISIMTGHTSKGLEFPVVFVTGLVDQILPSSHALSDSPKALEEERRLFYVMMTRAKKRLFVSHYGGSRFGSMPNLPSPFLKEIGFKAKDMSSDARYGFGRRMSRSDAPFSSARKKNSSYASDNFMFNQINKYADDHGYDDDSSFGGLSGAKIPIKATVSFSSNSVKSTAQIDTNANGVEYKPGDKIAHASFGVGTVMKVEGRKLTVQFSREIGTKMLIAGFKAFKKI